MKNNNQKILRLLAKREYQENKRRNRILIGTVAFAVWMIFCVFSLAIGKVQADYLLMVRNGGTKASTTLEDPSEEQYRKIQEAGIHPIRGNGDGFCRHRRFFVYGVRQDGVGEDAETGVYGYSRGVSDERG